MSYLFNGAPDLLHEFKQFLPEITGQPVPDFVDDFDMSFPRKSYDFLYPCWIGYSCCDLYSWQTDAWNVSSNWIYATWKTKTHGGKPLFQPCYIYIQWSLIQLKRTKDAKLDEEMIDGYPASSYFDPARPTISSEEVELFEQIRKHIGNKPSYEEFLKTLNLFTQQIIDADILMKQVEGFIGSDRDLFEWFKTVVAIDLKDRAIERPANIIAKPDLNHCKTVDTSPSYRLVSKDVCLCVLMLFMRTFADHVIVL